MTVAFTADVLSPQFPCGAAWLANALLELGCELPELWGFDTAREWQPISASERRYVADDLPWRQTLASLQLDRVFATRQNQRLRFSHALPWQAARAPTSLLMVRDPRDALHSEWQRQLRNSGLSASIDLVEFASMPFFGGPISHIDMLWLHVVCWLSTDRAPRLLRFEDCKRAPLRSLAQVAEWLNVDCDVTALESAIEASRVEHLQKTEAALSASEPNSRIFNRAGKVFEWMTAWPESWHTAFGPHWQRVFAQLNYSASVSMRGQPLRFDLSEVLAWRGMSDARHRQEWAARLEDWR